MVATPIGNLKDITLRALETLQFADLIACEDTRVTGKLLNHYGISAPMISYNDHNAKERRPEIILAIEQGKRVILVSDAGTPLISDPGYKLIRELIDKNLYFTFPTRREDCLALGTIADGVLGDYHFRHPPYAAYMRTCRDGQPGLQGGLWRTSQETALLPLTTAILSGTIPSHIAAVFQTIPMGETNLLAHWQQHQFIEASREKEGFCLTANGAWFAGNMVKTLAGLTASNISHIPAKNEPL